MHYKTARTAGIQTAGERISLQHTAPHCNTLQNAATCCNTLQHTTPNCKTMQHTATQCNTQHRAAPHCTTDMQILMVYRLLVRRKQCYTLRHTATHCNSLQPSSTHCSPLQNSENTAKQTCKNCWYTDCWWAKRCLILETYEYAWSNSGAVQKKMDLHIWFQKRPTYIWAKTVWFSRHMSAHGEIRRLMYIYVRVYIYIYIYIHMYYIYTYIYTYIYSYVYVYMFDSKRDLHE